MWLTSPTLLSLRLQPFPVSVMEANGRFDTSGTRWVYTESTKCPPQKPYQNMANSLSLCSLEWLPQLNVSNKNASEQPWAWYASKWLWLVTTSSITNNPWGIMFIRSWHAYSMITADWINTMPFTQTLVRSFVSKIEKRARSSNALHPIKQLGSESSNCLSRNGRSGSTPAGIFYILYGWDIHADRLLLRRCSHSQLTLYNHTALRREHFSRKAQTCGSNMRPAHDSGWYITKGLPHGLPIFQYVCILYCIQPLLQRIKIQGSGATALTSILSVRSPCGRPDRRV